MTKDEQKILWLALRHVDGLGPVAIRKKLDRHGSIEQLWQALDLPLSQYSSYVERATQEYELITTKNIQLLTLDDLSYPDNLKDVPDITPVLYVIGQLKPKDQQAIGVVGSRVISNYGREVTDSLVSQLVVHDFTIVSGMAKGVDTISHKSALDSGGRTIAVWGSGLDLVYPPENKDLARRIIENGAIISQFPLGTEAQKFTFPARNKLIAGLSQAVLVAEAKSKSGSLLTAQAAQKYNRPVFAVPGSIHSAGSAGPHSLIQNGARLVVDATDIVKTLGGSIASSANPQPSTIDATTQEQAILDLLQLGPLHIDELIRQSQQSSSQISSLVVMMEIKGMVKHLGGGEYRKS